MKNLLYAGSSRRRVIVPISNGSLLDFECDNLTGWTDEDTGEAVSDQVTFDGKSTFRFDTNTSADTDDQASRLKDIGSIDGLGNRIVISYNLYCDACAARANNDTFVFHVFRSDWKFVLHMAADGLFIYDGAAYVEAGTNLVVEDAWQEWTFDIDLSGGGGSAVCDIYVNQALIVSSFDCSYDTGGTDGDVRMQVSGHATDDQIAYVDWLKIGDGFA